MRTLFAFSASALVGVQLSCGGDPAGPDSNAASISANSATTLTARPGAAVIELPSVVVRDLNGSPVVGAHVTFAVTRGGGTVSGGSATTDASGIATVGSWTLGADPGTNTLEARIASLPVVTFTANGADPCAISNFTPYTLGASTTGQLSLGDCAFGDGSFVDFYTVTLPAAGTYTFSETSTAFDPFLLMYGPTGILVALNDDSVNTAALVNQNSFLKVLAPAGNYFIGANSYDMAQFGRYTLASATSSAHITNCEDAVLVPGITSLQSLQASDCAAAGSFSDDYVIGVNGGQQVIVTMSSGGLDSYLEIRTIPSQTAPNSQIVGFNDDADVSTKDARLSFTAPTPGAFYIIKARSTAAGVTGAYTIAVQ